LFIKAFNNRDSNSFVQDMLKLGIDIISFLDIIFMQNYFDKREEAIKLVYQSWGTCWIKDFDLVITITNISFPKNLGTSPIGL